MNAVGVLVTKPTTLTYIRRLRERRKPKPKPKPPLRITAQRGDFVDLEESKHKVIVGQDVPAATGIPSKIHSIGARKDYQAAEVEPLVLEYQEETHILNRFKARIHRAKQRRAVLPRVRQRYIASLRSAMEITEERRKRLLDQILRHTVRLAQVCFYKFRMHRNSSIDIDDYVHDCQAKIIKDCVPKFNPKYGRFHSLIFTSLQRYTYVYKKRVDRYYARHTLVGDNLSLDEGKDEAPCFVDEGPPILEEVWEKSETVRFLSLKVKILEIWKLLDKRYKHSGTATDLIDYFFTNLIRDGKFPMKKVMIIRFSGWVTQEKVQFYYNLCAAEARLHLRDYKMIHDPDLNSWD